MLNIPTPDVDVCTASRGEVSTPLTNRYMSNLMPNLTNERNGNSSLDFGHCMLCENLRLNLLTSASKILAFTNEPSS